MNTSQSPGTSGVMLQNSLPQTWQASSLARMQSSPCSIAKAHPLWWATASAALLWMSYFPLAWGWLGWVALAPLLALARMQLSTRQLLLMAWVGGLLFFFPVLQWIRVADYRMYATWISLALYCSLFIPAGIWLIRRLDRGTSVPLLVTVPLVWTGLEYVRAHALTGFAWYFLGHTQHDVLAVIQISDLGGAYAVTFLVAAVNALVFEWLCTSNQIRRLLGVAVPTPDFHYSRLLVWTTATLILLSGTIAYGIWRLRDDEFATGPRVALLQASLDQRIKNKSTQADGEKEARKIIDDYVALADKAAGLQTGVDLVIWPETAWPYSWTESPAGQPSPECRQLAQSFAKRWKVPQLIGLNTTIEDGGRRRLYNSAILIDSDGSAGPRYDKMHRVPFGEYVPLREQFPWMDRFAPYDFDYSIRAGEQFTRLPLGATHFGVLICYEDTDPYLARQYLRADPKVDFLVNISNDGWFDGTAEHEEHLAICRFRAVECRRSVARAVNMGVSAIVDGNGRVLAPSQALTQDGTPRPDVWEIRTDDGKAQKLPMSEWNQFKAVPAVIVGAIPLDDRESLYAAWGDWLPQACWVMTGLCLVWTFLRRRAQLQME